MVCHDNKRSCGVASTSRSKAIVGDDEVDAAVAVLQEDGKLKQNFKRDIVWTSRPRRSG